MGINDRNICLKCGRLLQINQKTTRYKKCDCGAKYSFNTLQEPTAMHMPDFEIPSRFMVNSEGAYKSQHYTLTGRLKMLLEDSVVNYWTMLFTGDEVKFLAESYGFIAVLTPLNSFTSETLALKLENTTTDVFIEIEGLGNIKKLYQDDLWFFDFEGISAFTEKTTKYLFKSNDGTSYYEFWVGDEDITVYKCDWVTVEELSFKETQPIILTEHITTVNCAHCNALIKAPYFPFVRQFICEKCHTLNKFTKEMKWEATYHLTKYKFPEITRIAIGTVLFIKGIDYIVIGTVIKKDNNGYQWQEFTMYCRDDGSFCYLSVYNGNFMLTHEIADSPVLADPVADELTYQSKGYRLYNSYNVTIQWGEGVVFDEFDENIKSPLCYDYIAPPHLIAFECYDNKNTTCYKGVYISRKELKKHNPSINLPLKYGVGMIEPASKYNATSVGIAGAFMGILLLLVHIVMDITGMPSKVVLENNYHFADSLKSTIEIVSDTFSVTNFRSNVTIEVDGYFNNNWISLDYTLVNAVSGNEYSTGKDMEFYSGMDGGDSWTEGSKKYTHLFTAVRRGKYFLNLEAQKGTDYGYVEGIKYRVIVGSKKALNLWLPLILILIWPVIILINIFSKEQARWSNDT